MTRPPTEPLFTAVTPDVGLIGAGEPWYPVQVAHLQR